MTILESCIALAMLIASAYIHMVALRSVSLEPYNIFRCERFIFEVNVANTACIISPCSTLDSVAGRLVFWASLGERG